MGMLQKSLVDAPTLSTIPPSQQSFLKKRNDYDRRGGGAVIPCKFTLICHDSASKKVTDYLTHELNELTFQGEEQLENIAVSNIAVSKQCTLYLAVAIYNSMSQIESLEAFII